MASLRKRLKAQSAGEAATSGGATPRATAEETTCARAIQKLVASSETAGTSMERLLPPSGAIVLIL